MRRAPDPNRRSAGQRGPRGRSFFSALYGAFIAGGIVFGAIFATSFADVIEAMGNHAPGIPLRIVSKGTDEGGADWSSKERVNILLLGIDERPAEKGSPSRTDTIMVATLDPNGKTAGILSIPRDLLVTIRTSGGLLIQDRINTAYFYGEYYDHPGGGVALARETVENLLGIHIHYYALIDFEGFSKVVDSLGGVTVTLETPLVDNEYPDESCQDCTMSIYIPDGRQHLDGEKALWYARSRHMDSDIGRMERQQQLMMAMRDRALQIGAIFRIPFFLRELGGAFKTDLSVSEMKRLADFSKDLGDNVTRRELDYSYVEDANIGGASVLLLREDAPLSALVQEVFYDPRQPFQAAKIEVLNATQQDGLAARAASLLERQGLSNVTCASANGLYDDQETTIYDFTGGNMLTARLVADVLNIPYDRILSESAASNGSAQIRVILADDADLPPDF